jgi:hypothetical protein
MIDTQTEHVITFPQAADGLPRRRQGRKISVATFYRWSTAGCRGVILETVQIGGSRCTSREALQRFFERLSVAQQAPPASGDDEPHAPAPGPRSAARRRRESARAGQELVEMGA